MIIFDRIIEYGIIFLIVLTPLAFGSVHFWAYTTIELTMFFLVIIWVLKQIIVNRQLARTGIRPNGEAGQTGGSSTRNPQPVTRSSKPEYNRFGLVKTPLNFPIILFICFAIFQLIPLPSGLLKLISPNTNNLHNMTQPGWPEGNVSHLKPLRDLTDWHSWVSIWHADVTRNIWPRPHQGIQKPLTRDLQPETNNSESELTNQQSLNSSPQTEHNNVLDKSEIQILKSQVQTTGGVVAGQAKIRNPQSTNHNYLTLSIYPYATKTELLKILAYIGMFFLITNMPGIRVDRIVMVIVSVGFFISIIGILQKLTGTKEIYWFRDASYAEPFGPYINRNHFAGYIGMTIPLASGWLISRFASLTFYGHKHKHSFVAEFQSYFITNLLITFVIVIMISALFLSLSRGGVVSFIVSVVAFCTLVCFTRLRAVMGNRWRTIVSVLVVTFVLIIWMGISPFLDRISSFNAGNRLVVYSDTIKLAKDFPVCGTGMGTFKHVYPGYKTLSNQLLYTHAHNDYLELLSDNGLVGFMIVLSGFVMFFWKTLARWWERRHHYAKGVALGGICGIIAISVHSFSDFNLHNPANALLLSIILGLTHNIVNLRRY